MSINNIGLESISTFLKMVGTVCNKEKIVSFKSGEFYSFQIPFLTLKLHLNFYVEICLNSYICHDHLKGLHLLGLFASFFFSCLCF